MYVRKDEGAPTGEGRKRQGLASLAFGQSLKLLAVRFANLRPRPRLPTIVVHEDTATLGVRLAFVRFNGVEK